MDFVKNPVRCCQHVHTLIQKLMDIVRIKKDDPKTKGMISYIIHIYFIYNCHYKIILIYIYLFIFRCNSLSW